MARLSALEWVIGSLGEGLSEVVNIWNEEGQTMDRALRNTTSGSERAASSTTKEELCSSVWQNGPCPAAKERREARSLWRRLGVTVRPDPSRKLPRHFRPPLSRGSGTAPPRWGVGADFNDFDANFNAYVVET